MIEPPLAGWSVEVYDSTNTLVTTLTTDALGQYSTIAPVGCGGIFILKQVVQPGWTQSFPPSSGFHMGLGTGCGPTFGPYDFGNKQPNCLPFTKTYTLDADFNLGTLSRVVTNSDQLELSPTSTTWQFAWIANASEGTISKVNTQTGKEVGRYYTGPADGGNGYGYLSPSRTVVDLNGDCWVANRNLSSAHLASLSQIVEIRGNSSQIWMPGTLVWIGLNSPRISAGASGLGSKVSCCGGPPWSQRKMTFLALPKVAPRRSFVEALACDASSAGNERPSALSPPTRSNSRRLKAPDLRSLS